MREFKESRFSSLMLLAASLMFALTACGGGGGGGGGGKKAGLPDGTFIKVSTYEPTSTYTGNFATSPTNRLMQALYDPSAVKGSGYIMAISLISNSTTSAAITCPDITIKMGHTNVTELSTTYANNYETGQGALETVLANAQAVIPIVSSGDYFTIQLDTPFYYNGVDKLIVEMTRIGACDGSLLDSSDNTLSANYTMWENDPFDGTGLVGQAGVPAKFHFKGGVDQITQDGIVTGWFYPFTDFGFPSYQKAQMLYHADEINGSGPITGIALKVGLTTSNVVYTLDIKIGHTALGNLVAGSDFADNFSGKPVTVASGAIWNVPAGVPAGDYVWLPFPDGVFKYNGKDNLLIEYNITSASGDFYPASTPVATNRRLYGPSDGTTSSLAANALYIARFRFKGGTMDVIPSGYGEGVSNVFYSGASRAFMLKPDELGTKGTINKLACRLYDSGPTVAATYTNLKIQMESTTADVLVGGTTNNLTNPITVFSGDFNLPADLIAGDWIEIPFTTPFKYDGTSNLVVVTSNDSGTQAYACKLYGPDATRYPSQYAGTGTADYKVGMRLWLK